MLKPGREPNPEEVEALRAKIRAAKKHKKGEEVAFPQKEAQEEPIELNIPPTEEMERAEFMPLPPEHKKSQYQEGDPVVFEQAKKDKKFLQYLIESAKIDVSKIDFEKPTFQDRTLIVRLYEDFQNIQKE